MNQLKKPTAAQHIVVAIESTDLRLAVELMLSEDPDLIFVGAVSNAEGLDGLVEKTHPDLIILQGDSEQFAIADLCADLNRLELSPRIIYLGKDFDSKDAALAAGADAFVLIGSSPDHLQEAIWVKPDTASTDLIHYQESEED